MKLYYMTGISTQDLRTLFLELDVNRNNQISFREFAAMMMREEISPARKATIRAVFENIDKDGDGIVSIKDIGECFQPQNHPDVKARRSTVNNLLKTFFESFSVVSDTGYLNLQQFTDYYIYSSAFEDDLRFSESMKNLWSMKSLLPSSTTTTPRGTTLRSYDPNNPAVRSAASSSTWSAAPSIAAVDMDMDTDKHHLQAIVYDLREQLKVRGARGMVGLQRKFRILDDNGE
jgi:Ca2+-binding EF-hand superfamily protein